MAPFVVVRTHDDPASLAQSVRAALKSLEKDMVVYDMRTMTDVLGASVAERRFILVLAMAFGVLAWRWLRSASTASCRSSSSERTQEMGIRLALGAEPCAC